MKFTENFNLNLPDLDDKADIRKLNENFETIDTKMKSLETDPELAANVVDIKNKIGTESDADTQQTLFGRLAQLKNVLVEKLAEVLTKVTGIDGKIGTSGDPAGTATLFGQVKDISEKMPDGFIKSIQRQNWTGNITSHTFTISEVNTEKSIVLVTGFETCESAYFSGYIESFTKTSVTIGKEQGNITLSRTVRLTIQVIEFF